MRAMRVLRDSWFLTGPTAAGKSAVGVELARQIGAEIVSMDSMALYRGMDIGTAKPTARQRRDVPHHLIDVLDPWHECSLAQYVELAGQAAAEIAGRGREVLFLGGTPLYLKALLRGIFRGPPADWELRRRLVEEAQRQGANWLHRRLAEVDPPTAARLHPNDTRRLVRALEVFEKTGQPISQLQRQFEIGRPAAECRVFMLYWPKAELHARIDRRVEEMFAAGLVEEVRGLCSPDPLSLWERARVRAVGDKESVDSDACPPSPHPRPLSQTERGDNLGSALSHTAGQAVGYREVIEHLEGRRGLPETVALVQRHTRQLAKRQMTWFRSLSECRFLPVSGHLDAGEIAGRIALLAERR
jgi:tRNA dimethylallyltransferase